MFFKNQHIGKYQILDTIGSGGFGSVYLAVDELIQKKVAIKVPHKQADNREKLLQEPRILAELNHPNIVAVLTAEYAADIFFIVMEYVEGWSLEQHLRKVGRLKLEQGLDWFIKLGDAMAYAHGKNVIHRDIRPANVLISKDGQVKLADLGTSRYLVDEPFASTRIGSPPYMAPEHFQGKATFQSDIYSFGIMMYEALTGRLPYFHKEPLKIAQLAREADYPNPRQLNGEIPLELSQIIMKSMQRMLGSRYQSAKALLDDLKRSALQLATLDQPNSLLLAPTGTVVPQVAQPPPPQVPAPASSIEGSVAKMGHPILVESAAERQARRGGNSVRLKDIQTREFSDLFCWNCSRPVQRRTQSCPHCGVSLK